MNICDNCKKSFSEELILTDHYRGEEIKKYCEDCFYKGAVTAFDDQDLKCDCGQNLVLSINDKVEIIDLARSHGIIDYECEILSEARRKDQNLDELEEKHDTIGFYVLQPEDQEWEN